MLVDFVSRYFDENDEHFWKFCGGILGYNSHLVGLQASVVTVEITVKNSQKVESRFPI